MLIFFRLSALCRATLVKVPCNHNKKDHRCNTCNTFLCQECIQKHVNSSHVVFKLCTHIHKKYFCKFCGALCGICTLKHAESIRRCSHDVVFVCTNQEKPYSCRTCKQYLCIQCKDEHVVTSRLENIRNPHDVVVVCVHQEKDYICRTCRERICKDCKLTHSFTKEHVHDIVISCTHREKYYHCTSCNTSLCVRCNEKHSVEEKHSICFYCEHKNKKYFCKNCRNFICEQCEEKHCDDLEKKDIFLTSLCSHSYTSYNNLCRTCSVWLCSRCSFKHIKQVCISQEATELIRRYNMVPRSENQTFEYEMHDIVKYCIHYDVDFMCALSKYGSCYLCLGLDQFQNLSPTLPDIGSLCNHPNKPFICRTCEICMCFSCKIEHNTTHDVWINERNFGRDFAPPSNLEVMRQEEFILRGSN